MTRLPSPHGLAALALALAALGPGAARAEMELSFYGGWQGAPSGGVTLSGEEAGLEEEGGARGGVRATWWGPGGLGDGLGVGVELSRSDLSWGTADVGADGLGLLTVTGLRRWPGAFGTVTPYVGAGLGVAFPDGSGGEAEAGPALTVTAGAAVPLTEGWSVFGEYQGAYAAAEVEDEGGAALELDGFTSGVNLGISFSF